MTEVGWRLLWVAFVVALIAYASYLFFASSLSAAGFRQGPVVIVDSVVPGIHSLQGMIMIPSECHNISHKVRKESVTLYSLEFTSWHEPYRDCPKTPALYAFKTTAFAPALGVTFAVSLDGKPLDVHVVSSYGILNEEE